MTDQSGTFDDVADDIKRGTNKGLKAGGRIIKKASEREAFWTIGGATAGAVIAGPLGALTAGIIGYFIFELKD